MQWESVPSGWKSESSNSGRSTATDNALESAYKAHRWLKYEELVDKYRMLAAQLSTEVANDISYRNAEKLYGVKVDGD